MSRADLIRRIEEISDEDFSRVTPILEADLDLLTPPAGDFDGAALEAEIQAGQASARTEPLESHESVQARVRERLSRGS